MLRKRDPMTDATKLRFLRPVLALIGLIAIALWPAFPTVASGISSGTMVGARSYYFSHSRRPHHLGHLWGDVPLLLFGGALVAWLMPRKVGHNP